MKRSTPVPHSFTLALLQMRCTKDPDENLSTALKMIAEAARRKAGVICLPELFRSLYFCQCEDHDNFELAEPLPGPTTEALSAAAKKHEVVIVGSIFERRTSGLYHNTAVVIDADGRLAGTYRKMHIPDDPLYYEKFYFTPGDLGFHAFETRAGRIAPLVCWDQWYPEGARLSSLDGACLLLYPTAIGWHPKEKAKYGAAQRDAWRTIQRSHAIANGVYVAAVNRVGHEGPAKGGLEFWGSSFISDPFGTVLAEGSTGKSEIVLATVDLRHQETVRRHWPFLRDRRVDAYAPILERWRDRK